MSIKPIPSSKLTDRKDQQHTKPLIFLRKRENQEFSFAGVFGGNVERVPLDTRVRDTSNFYTKNTNKNEKSTEVASQHLNTTPPKMRKEEIMMDHLKSMER